MSKSNTFNLVRSAVAALFISGLAAGSAQAAHESSWIFPHFAITDGTTAPAESVAQDSKAPPRDKMMVKAAPQQPESWTRLLVSDGGA
ncbi:MAG: hypothetical protein H7X91_05175 [Burkholderiales bacterium]|nr:hypothetical protein [Burkholderiales bacterium]